jgi:hypothetical protein
MKRRLRIAVSVFFALVAVAFAVLWVRSHYRYYGLVRTYPNQSFFILECADGEIACSRFNRPASRNPAGYIFFSKPVERPRLTQSSSSALGFQFLSGPQSDYFVLPIWFPMLLFGLAAAALPFKPTRRFSLRTLLIATTLVAVVLGLAVWASG